MKRTALFMGVVGLLACGDDDGAGDDAAVSASQTGTMTGVATEADESSGDPDGSESSTGEPLPEVDFEADIQPLLNANCTCHLQGESGTMTAPFLTLNPGMSHGELVGVAAMQAADLSRVAAGDLDGSYLWHKLQGTHMDVGGMGTMMPPGVSLTDDDITLIRAWIVGGAMP